MIQTGFKQEYIEKLVRNWLFTGEYGVGDTLPGDKVLAKTLGVNHLTVAKALRPLIEEGLLERIPRRGTLVRKNLLPVTSNAVGLVMHSQDQFYSDMVSEINRLLDPHNLFPTLINEDLVENTAAIGRFLDRMVGETRPYGYLVLGDMNFSYDKFRNEPNKFQNAVFLLRYQAEELIPHSKYVLIDYKDIGRQSVKYFAKRGMKKILFPAISETGCKGLWASLQFQVMQGIREESEKIGIFFDELLFWKTFNGKELKQELVMAVQKTELPFGIFTWSDSHFCVIVKPVLNELGITPGKYQNLGNFNTFHAVENNFSSFDLRIGEICKIAVDMLVGNTDERNVILNAKLIER